MCLCVLVVILLGSCQKPRDPGTAVFLIEFHPTNLDPRVGDDAQSQRIDQLLFDGLVHRDENFRLGPSLAERWEIPDPLTYIFHLRRGVRFHDGRPFGSRDVRYTFTSMLDGSVATVKAGTYRLIASIETPDDSTVVFHLREPYAGFLWNVAQGAIGIVPQGAGQEARPVGTGPFRFVRARQDEEVVIEANPDYWGGSPRLGRVQFRVVPDAVVRALELRKGAADMAINALTPDMVRVLGREPHLAVAEQPGTIYQYLALNLEDPLLRRREVRQALAYAIDVQPLIAYLWRGQARPATSVLPPSHWAFNPRARAYSRDPQRARELLDAAGLRPGKDGVRARLTLKTSTEETSRQVAAVFQQQLKQVGLSLDIRSSEFATFYADILKGAFQMYTLRWIGANNDPDIFDYCFHSRRAPPRGANRGHYSNPQVDRLLDQARATLDLETRRELYFQVEEILNEDLPYIHLWYFDNVVVYDRRLAGLEIFPSGDYDFLKQLRVNGTSTDLTHVFRIPQSAFRIP